MSLDQLYTFGSQDFVGVIPQKKNEKSPFAMTSKYKKISNEKKKISQQRQQQKNQQLKQAVIDEEKKKRVVSFYNKKNKPSEPQPKENINILQIPVQKLTQKKKRKISLPKIFTNNMPSARNSSTGKKRVISSEMCSRYKNQQNQDNIPIRPFESRQYQKLDYDCYNSNKNRPKSMMFISQEPCSALIQKHKHQTIPQKKTYIRRGKCASSYNYKPMPQNLSTKIFQNIEYLKQIYGKS